MTDGRSLTTISAADYEAIESAVMETERGRWFLKEFARRNRMADTQVLLEAIGRLEKAVAGERVAQDIDRLRSNLKDMATAISRTKSEIASIHAVEQEHSHLFAASEALDGITRTTEQATSDILAAAEQIQEAAWTLREDGANPDLCDDLDRRATEIYTACSFQDITAQRIAKIIQTLRYLEGRINAMIAVWECGAVDAHLEEVVATFDHGVRDDVGSLDLTQGDIDCVIVEGDFFATEPGEAAEPNEAPRSECKSDGPELPFSDEIPPRDFATTTSAENTAPRSLQASTEVIDVEAFTDIDQLPTRERLRLFT